MASDKQEQSAKYWYLQGWNDAREEAIEKASSISTFCQAIDTFKKKWSDMK